MNTLKLISSIALAVSLAACGGGGSSSSSGGTSGGTGGSTGGGFPSFDGNYLDENDLNPYNVYRGQTGFATLTRDNASYFVDLLFERTSDSAPTDTPAFRGENSNTVSMKVDQSFLGTQKEIMRRTQNLVLPPPPNEDGFLDRTVQDTERCDNPNGFMYNTADIDDFNRKSKMRVVYEDCVIEGLRLNGIAYFFLYTYDDVARQPSSTLLAYDYLEVSGSRGNYTLYGSLGTVNDYNAGTVRDTYLLHRRYTAGQEDLLDLRLFNLGTGYRTMEGVLYDGVLGSVTIQAFEDYRLYFANTEVPQSGYFEMFGAPPSSARVNAVGNSSFDIAVFQ